MNALATLDNVAGMSFAELAALTGQQVADTGSFVPALKINKDADDDDGNVLPIGQYMINTAEHGKVFSRIEKTSGFLKIQPLFQGFRYGIWDQDTKKYSRLSVIFGDFSKDAPDDGGGNKCGKMTKKQIEAASEAVKEVQKGIKCARIIYGLVSGTFYSLKGEKVDLDNYLVVWQMQGSSFMAVNTAMEQLSKAKRTMVMQYLTLEKPQREKNGATIYYVPVISLDMSMTAPFEQDHVETLRAILETVKKDNDVIMEKHKAAVAKRNGVSDAEITNVVKDVTGSTLADDFNDDLPY